LIEKDAGGIKACSRWLRSASDDTTGRRHDQQFLHPGRGASRIFLHPNPEGAAALNQRLHTYNASGILFNAECVICDRPDYNSNKIKNSHLIARATSGDMAYNGPISIVNLTYAYPNKKVVGPMPSSGANYK